MQLIQCLFCFISEVCWLVSDEFPKTKPTSLISHQKWNFKCVNFSSWRTYLSMWRCSNLEKDYSFWVDRLGSWAWIDEYIWKRPTSSQLSPQVVHQPIRYRDEQVTYFAATAISPPHTCDKHHDSKLTCDKYHLPHSSIHPFVATLNVHSFMPIFCTALRFNALL